MGLVSYKNLQGDDLSNYVAPTIYFEIKDREKDKDLQQRMIDEALRAKLFLEEMLSKTSYINKIHD